jgi:8-oxo-dGTP diphosphatase
MNVSRNPLIDVAAAVIHGPQDQVLLAQRPTGKPYAGYWEFPGGKIEMGEGALQALRRELHEELGIEVDDASPWLTRVYAYPEKTVRLRFFRVERWHGEPHGREGQTLCWQSPHAITVTPLLPANDPIMQALRLPAIYAITHATKWGPNEFLRRLTSALEKGVRLIQLREKEMSARDATAFAREVVALANKYDATVLINADMALDVEVGAAGLHLPSAQLMRLGTRPPARVCAASCHTPAELKHAAALGLDFVVLSQVLATASHPGAPSIGWPRFAELIADYPLPVYALGGMRLDDLSTARRHGAHGIASMSAVW